MQHIEGDNSQGFCGFVLTGRATTQAPINLIPWATCIQQPKQNQERSNNDEPLMFHNLRPNP